jgi:multidrug efflux system outer membrane protein
LLQVGCGGTAYQRPPAPIAATWPAEIATRGTQAPRELRWQDFFQDPHLRALIERALVHNRDLRLAVGRIEEARLALGLAEAERLPNIGLNTYNTKQALSPSVAGGKAGVNAQEYDFKLQLLSYEVDFWGRLGRLSDAARARMEGTEAAARVVRISLIAEVANAYYLRLDLRERIHLLGEIIRTREQTRDLTQQGFESGAVSKLEVLQADSALEAAKGELASLKSQLAATNNSLTFLTGHGEGELPPGYSLASQRLDAAFAVDVPSVVLLQRPDVVAAEQRLIEAHANVDAARAMFFPRLMLTATAGFASLALGELFSAQGRNAWSYVGNITMPIFDGGRTEGGLDMAKLREVQAVSDYERTIQVAFREVADLLAARQAAVRQKQTSAATWQIQQQRALATEARFRGGAVSYLEVLDALREELSAAQQLVVMRRTELTNATLLYKALGGGEDVIGVPGARVAQGKSG